MCVGLTFRLVAEVDEESLLNEEERLKAEEENNKR